MYETEVKTVGMSFRSVKERVAVGDKVRLVPEPDNKYDPNALAIQTLDGAFLGYVAKKDKLRTKMLARAKKEEVLLPVLVANYYKDGDDKLWDTVTEGDLTQLWLRAYSKTPLEDDSFAEVTSYTGEKVLWSESLHVCTDLKGNELIGGSTYASQFQRDFDSEKLAKAYATKNEFKTEDVLSYWESLKDISQDYGTAIHKAMEHYAKYYKMVGHEDALPRVPHLRKAVKSFLEQSSFDKCVAEPLITDTQMGMSGWIDLLKFVGDNKVVIIDYKTNTFKDDKSYYSKWKPKMKEYKNQFDYYGTILENFGYEVVGHELWHWYNEKWDKYELKFDSIEQYRRKAA